MVQLVIIYPTFELEPPQPSLAPHRNISSTTHHSCYVIFRILRPPFNVSVSFSCFIVAINVITHYPLSSQTSALWEKDITGPVIWHTAWHFWYFRVSLETRMFKRQGVLQNFANFHLCRSLFFNKTVGLRPPSDNFIKRLRR